MRAGNDMVKVGGPSFRRDGIFELAAPDETFPDAAIALGALPGGMVLPRGFVAAGMALHDRHRRAGKRCNEIVMFGEICGEHGRPL